jgi:hypothetical protein
MTPHSLQIEFATLSKNIIVVVNELHERNNHTHNFVLGQKSHDPRFDALVAPLSKNISFIVTGQHKTGQKTRTVTHLISSCSTSPYPTSRSTV